MNTEKKKDKEGNRQAYDDPLFIHCNYFQEYSVYETVTERGGLFN